MALIQDCVKLKNMDMSTESRNEPVTTMYRVHYQSAFNVPPTDWMPFTLVKELILSGEIKTKTLVQISGDQKWRYARGVTELKPILKERKEKRSKAIRKKLPHIIIFLAIAASCSLFGLSLVFGKGFLFFLCLVVAVITILLIVKANAFANESWKVFLIELLNALREKTRNLTKPSPSTPNQTTPHPGANIDVGPFKQPPTTEKGIVYLVQLDFDGRVYSKIGITGRSTVERYSGHGAGLTIVREWVVGSIEIAKEIEQKILWDFGDYRAAAPDHMDGYTETFELARQAELLSAIQTLIHRWQIEGGTFGGSVAELCDALNSRDKNRIDLAIGRGGQRINIRYKDTRGRRRETTCTVLALNGKYLRFEDEQDGVEKSVTMNRLITSWA